MLRYAYAELEESRGAIQVSRTGHVFYMLKSLGLSIELASALLQSAKKIYESLLGDGVNTTALAHIQVSNFELFGGHFFFFRVI